MSVALQRAHSPIEICLIKYEMGDTCRGEMFARAQLLRYIFQVGKYKRHKSRYSACLFLVTLFLSRERIEILNIGETLFLSFKDRVMMAFNFPNITAQETEPTQIDFHDYHDMKQSMSEAQQFLLYNLTEKFNFLVCPIPRFLFID